MRSRLALVLCALAFVSMPAWAVLIDSEDQPPGPSTFAAAGPTQTLVYNLGGVMATFTGGVILTNETSQTTDNTNVYATASFGDPTLTNPLVVTFDQPIHNFQLDILNAILGDYTLADNAGHSVNFNLPTTGGSLATEGFAAAGTVVTITYNGPGVTGASFDFAIDNVRFDEPLHLTPEPGSIMMFGVGLVALGTLRLRKHGQ
jgi:hypothetical protein